MIFISFSSMYRNISKFFCMEKPADSWFHHSTNMCYIDLHMKKKGCVRAITYHVGCLRYHSGDHQRVTKLHSVFLSPPSACCGNSVFTCFEWDTVFSNYISFQFSSKFFFAFVGNHRRYKVRNIVVLSLYLKYLSKHPCCIFISYG